MQTPPEFRPKKYVPVRNKIITTVGIILLSGVVGFGAGYAPVFRGLHHECLEAILRKS